MFGMGADVARFPPPKDNRCLGNTGRHRIVFVVQNIFTLWAYFAFQYSKLSPTCSVRTETSKTVKTLVFSPLELLTTLRHWYLAYSLMGQNCNNCSMVVTDLVRSFFGPGVRPFLSQCSFLNTKKSDYGKKTAFGSSEDASQYLFLLVHLLRTFYNLIPVTHLSPIPSKS